MITIIHYNNYKLQACSKEECMIGDQEYMIEHIQILLDSHPKCNFIRQILQRFCDDGTVH